MNTNNFPGLLVNSNQDIIINKCESYIEKLKHKDIAVNNIDSDLADLKPGWVLLKRNNLTGKSIIKKHLPKNIVEKHIEIEEYVGEDAEDAEDAEDEPLDLSDSLIKLHEKRRNEYIDNYGYEEWERMFKFPNWIEEEAYLEMMEQQIDESDGLCDNDNDNDNNEYDYE